MPSTNITGIITHDHSIAREAEHKLEILGDHWAPIFTQVQTNEAQIRDFVKRYVKPSTCLAFRHHMLATMSKPFMCYRIVALALMGFLTLLGTRKAVL